MFGIPPEMLHSDLGPRHGDEEPFGHKRQPRIAPYSFKHSYGLSKKGQQTMEKVLQSFAIHGAERLQKVLNTPVTIVLLAMEKTSVERYLLGMSNPTFIAGMDIQPMNTAGLLEVNAVLVYSVVDKMLGGEGTPPTFVPQLHKLEMAFTRKFFNHIQEELSAAWKPIHSMEFVGHEIHTKPFLTEAIQPHELVFVATFKATLGNVQGLMTLALPARTFSLILHKFEPQEEHTSPPTKTLNLNDVPIQLTALLGSFELTLEEIKTLQPGDILTLTGEGEFPIDLLFDGESKFKAIPGLAGKYKGLLIKKAPEERKENEPWRMI